MTTTYRPSWPPHEGTGTLPYYIANRVNEFAYRLHEADRDFGAPLAGTDAGAVRRHLDATIAPTPAQEPMRPINEDVAFGIQTMLVCAIFFCLLFAGLVWRAG